MIILVIVGLVASIAYTFVNPLFNSGQLSATKVPVESKLTPVPHSFPELPLISFPLCVQLLLEKSYIFTVPALVPPPLSPGQPTAKTLPFSDKDTEFPHNG